MPMLPGWSNTPIGGVHPFMAVQCVHRVASHCMCCLHMCLGYVNNASPGMHDVLPIWAGMCCNTCCQGAGCLLQCMASGLTVHSRDTQLTRGSNLLGLELQEAHDACKLMHRLPILALCASVHVPAARQCACTSWLKTLPGCFACPLCTCSYP
jgi:hypothetical protein